MPFKLGNIVELHFHKNKIFKHIFVVMLLIFLNLVTYKYSYNSKEIAVINNVTVFYFKYLPVLLL